MRTGSQSSRSDVADNLALSNFFADLYTTAKTTEMDIGCLILIGMTQTHFIAIIFVVTALGHNPTGHRLYRRPNGCRIINGPMWPPDVQNRV